MSCIFVLKDLWHDLGFGVYKHQLPYQYRNETIFEITASHTELFSSSASWNFMQSRRGRDLCYLIEGVAKHMVSLSIKHKQTTIQDAKDCPNYWNKRKSLYFVTRKTLYFCKDYFNGDLTSGTKYLDWLKKSLIKSEKKVAAMRKSQRVAENISFPFQLVILKQTFMKLIIWQTLTKLKMLTMEELWYSF